QKFSMIAETVGKFGGQAAKETLEEGVEKAAKEGAEKVAHKMVARSLTTAFKGAAKFTTGLAKASPIGTIVQAGFVIADVVRNEENVLRQNLFDGDLDIYDALAVGST